MPQVCRICRHTAHEAINVELGRKIPLRDIAGRHHVSRSALSRHRRHMPQQRERATDGAPEPPAAAQPPAPETPWHPLVPEAAQELVQALHGKASRATFRLYEATNTDATTFYALQVNPGAHLNSVQVMDTDATTFYALQGQWELLDQIVGWLLAQWLREGSASASQHTLVQGLYKISLVPRT
jgi:hypothetical protein